MRRTRVSGNRFMGRSTLIAIGLLAPIGAAVPGTGLARAGVAGTTRPAIFAFSDSRVLPSNASLRLQAQQAKSTLCAGSPQPPAPMGLDTALAHATAFLTDRAGAPALAALAHGPQARSEGSAEAGMAAAVVAGSPAAALAAALLAHQKAPGDPAPLISASALLTTLGMPNEALALIDAAGSPPATPMAPLGAPLSAIAANNRGYALLALHLWRQAEKPLLAATVQAPHLQQAAANLSQAYLCGGDTPQAMHFFVAGSRVDQFQGDIVGDGSAALTIQQPPANRLFDLSRGVARHLPDLRYPATPGQAVAVYAFYARAQQRDEVAMLAAIQKRTIAVETPGAPPHLSPATMQRAEDITNAMQAAPFEPGLRELWAAVQKANNDEVFAEVTAGGQQSRACQIIALHPRWLMAMQGLDAAVRAYYSAYSKYATGLAANLSIPYYHAFAETIIDQQTWSLYYNYLVDRAIQMVSLEWSNQRLRCITGSGGAGAEMDPTIPSFTPPAPECPPGLSAVEKFSVNLGFVSLNANCEQVSGTIESEGLIKGFISGQYDTHGKALTVVAGTKAGVSVPGLGGEAGGGFYITVDRGGIQDWGIRMSASGSVGGTLSYEAISGEMNISLAGSIDYIPTAFGVAR